MRNRYLLAGLMAVALPGAALAQPADPRCVASNHDSRVEGTVLGGVAGALIGGALGHGAGAAVGGLTGAVAGNTIAGARNQPCPPGYYYAPPPGYGPPPPGAYGPPPGPAAYGPPAFWSRAPMDIRQRIDFMQSRIQEAADQGRLSHRETRAAYAEIRNIRMSARDLWQRDGGLSAPDRDYLQSRLDNLGQRLHWMEHTSY